MHPRIIKPAHATSSGPSVESRELIPLIERIFVAIEDIRAQLSGKRKEFLTTEEVAEATGRSEYTIRRWIAEKRLEAVRVPGGGPRGRLLIARSEFEKLVASGVGARIPATSLD